jgi:hypothetical protein
MFTILGQRKQAEMQWLQDPNQNNGDNLNSVRHEADRRFRGRKRACLNAKVNELETQYDQEYQRLV